MYRSPHDNWIVYNASEEKETSYPQYKQTWYVPVLAAAVLFYATTRGKNNLLDTETEGST